MITDNQIDELIQPIINLYSKMEYDLIVEIAKRFANYNDISGSLEWQLHKLDELGGLNKTAIKIISAYAKKSEAEVERILKQAGFINVDFETLNEAYKNNQLSINPLKMLESPAIAATLENSYKELNETFRLIRTKALESTKQAYMNIINTSYLEVASGMYDYQTSIKRGIQKMASKGIDGATYRRNGKIVKYSIEATVRRDTLTAVHQTANRVALQSCKEMKCDYVEISQHLGARVHPTNPIANHAGWQGKVFKIEGKAKGYPNLKESTGYPDDILGLGGVNCRHRMFPFFPGISVANPIKYDEKENRRVYAATQHQRKLERDIRKLKKQQAAAKEIDDKDTVKLLQRKLDNKYEEINNYCEQNGLKRDYSRELVTEQVYKKTVENNSDYDIIKAGSESGLDVTIDKFTPCLENAKTGEIVETTYTLANESDLRQLNGWNFDWLADDLKNTEIYKLQIKGDSEIQGLVSLTRFVRDKAIYVNIAESAPHNLGHNKKYNGVGGHLFAIAAQTSKVLGYGGFVFMDAKNVELVKHYRDTLGAQFLGIPHQYRMFIDEDAAEKLLKIYTLNKEGL